MLVPRAQGIRALWASFSRGIWVWAFIIIFLVVYAGPQGSQGPEGMLGPGVEVGVFIIMFLVVCAGAQGPQGPKGMFR